MRAPRPLLAFGCLLAAGLLVAGCGGGSSSTSGEGGGAAPVAESLPAPPKSAFPATEGRTLKEVEELADQSAQLGISTAAQVFYSGPNRYPFGVFEKGEGSKSGQLGSEVTDAEVAIYYACKAPAKASGQAKKGAAAEAAAGQHKVLEEPAVGPFPARIESLSSQPQYESRTTSESAGTARVVYSTQLNLPAAGECRPAALIKENGKVGAKLLPGFQPGEFTKVPRVGEKPPPIETPTAQEVGGDLAKITTRVPPDTLNKVNFAEALGKEPIVLLFATPQFCQSRVCGPVVDVAQEAQEKFGGQASFIHMEIYNENQPSEGVRPQVREFHLPSEPWLFTIDREGQVSSAVEGAFGPELLDKDVEEVVSE